MKMMCRWKTILGGLTVLLALGGNHARADLLINGNFSANPPGTTMAAGVTGWTWESLNGGGNPAFSFIRNDAFSAGIGGANYLWLNDAPGPEPTAYQDVALGLGTTVELTGVYHNIVLNPGAFGLAILFYDASTVTPTLLETNTFGTTSTSPSAPWASFDLVRTFNTTDLRVAFVSQFGSDADTGIANLSLRSVPEPSSLAMAGAGVFCLVGYRLRRHRRVS